MSHLAGSSEDATHSPKFPFRVIVERAPEKGEAGGKRGGEYPPTHTGTCWREARPHRTESRPGKSESEEVLSPQKS